MYCIAERQEAGPPHIYNPAGGCPPPPLLPLPEGPVKPCCTLLEHGDCGAEKPVPGVSSNALDQLLLLWLEAAKRLAQSLRIARALWLQYYPWSKGIKIDVAMQEGNKISMFVVSACPPEHRARNKARMLQLYPWKVCKIPFYTALEVQLHENKASIGSVTEAAQILCECHSFRS